LDRALRSEIEVVGAQADDFASQVLERMLEQQQLARRVHVRALPAPRVERVADLDAMRWNRDVVIARGADDRSGLQLAHRPGEPVTGFQTLMREFNELARLLGTRDVRIPELPQTTVARRRDQLVVVVHRKRFEADAATFERYGSGLFHAVTLKEQEGASVNESATCLRGRPFLDRRVRRRYLRRTNRRAVVIRTKSV